MLIDLHVRNLAVVAEASVEYAPGLNVLTGETGAGKSIVVDALALLRGARASSELVRSGADRLVVSGRFDLDAALARALAEVGLDVEDELVVRREIEREVAWAPVVGGRWRLFLGGHRGRLGERKTQIDPLPFVGRGVTRGDVVARGGRRLGRALTCRGGRHHGGRRSDEAFAFRGT